jgi:hypothetical protein
MYLEEFRRSALCHVTSQAGVKGSTSIWSREIKSRLPNPVTPDSLLNLSQFLRDIFMATSTSRSQSGVSVAGSSWQALVMWYLNLCFVGTNCVVVPPILKFRPSVLKDATDVRMNGRSSNTETDLLAFTVPNHSSLTDSRIASIDYLISSDLSNTRVTIIQCKTNWNDNAQIPMLWNQIYELARQGNRFANLSVGNTYQPSQFMDFTYAFVTVPTVKLLTKKGAKKFKPSSIAVQRVSGLTGGNYWGSTSEPNVAESLDRFFIKNFPTSFIPGGIRNSLKTNLLSGVQGFTINEFLEFSF